MVIDEELRKLTDEINEEIEKNNSIYKSYLPDKEAVADRIREDVNNVLARNFIDEICQVDYGDRIINNLTNQEFIDDDHTFNFRVVFTYPINYLRIEMGIQLH